MKNANEHDEMLAELARLNPVADEDLVGLVPEPGYDSLPSLIMLDDEVIGRRTVAGRARRRLSGVLQGALVARGVFVGAVASVCLLIIGLNLLLSDRVGGNDPVGFDAAAPTSLSDSNEVEEAAPSAEEQARETEAPGLPAGSATSTTSGISESEVSTGPEPSASGQPSTMDEMETTPLDQGQEATTDTTEPSGSTSADSSTPAEPCTVERPTLTQAVNAYRDHCSEPREDCDPIDDMTAWICSSEIIGAEGPSVTWGLDLPG